MNDKLKPCPFCGYPHPDRYPQWIICPHCGAEIHASEDKGVVDKWNTRAESSERIKELDVTMNDKDVAARVKYMDSLDPNLSKEAADAARMAFDAGRVESSERIQELEAALRRAYRIATIELAEPVGGETVALVAVCDVLKKALG